MAGGISVHGVDVAQGVPAEGLAVEIFALSPERRLLARGALGPDGLLDHPVAAGEGVAAGTYEVLFHLGDWMRARRYPEAQLRFLDVVPFRFQVADPAEHYHLPLKFTPWGLALFRGI
jgi:5-hydroxyisourate hydrolase